jgi:hypothetical protein
MISKRIYVLVIVFFELLNQWPVQVPKLDVPTIYKAYRRVI